MIFSLCGPRCKPPTRAEITDARAGKDPTKTYYLRARMRGESDRRWQLLARTIREALIDKDLLGMRGVGLIPHGDKTEGFAVWLNQELQQKVFGYDGSWVRPYIRQASAIAQRHAHAFTPAGQHDPLRVTQMETLAVNELRGIVAAAQQQITRVITNAMMINSSPTQAANAASGVIQTMRKRTHAMDEWMIARTHATTTLSIFRNAGVQRVGIIPERKRRKQTHDAGPEDEPRDPHGRWTSGAAGVGTETAAFKKWFGNSKVVDESGKPLVVYHGTRASDDFKAFSGENAPYRGGIIAFFYLTRVCEFVCGG
jgi:hypothetical protein